MTPAVKKKLKLTPRQVRGLEEYHAEACRAAYQSGFSAGRADKRTWTMDKLYAAIAHLDSIRGHLVAMAQQ